MRLYILDFDGTMGDTQGLIVKTMQQVIAELRLEPRTDSQCAAMIGLPLKQTFTDLIPMTDEMGERCAETYTRLFFANNTARAVSLFPHVVDTIKTLHDRGSKITIASSRSRQSLVDYVCRFGLTDYISYIVSANDVDNAKPHPEPVLKTLSELGISADDAIVVGDTSFDILMGNRAGCQTCGVSYGNGTIAELREAGANYIIDDFSKLLQL